MYIAKYKLLLQDQLQHIKMWMSKVSNAVHALMLVNLRIV